MDNLRIIYRKEFLWDRAKDLIPKGKDIHTKYKHYQGNRELLEKFLLRKTGEKNPDADPGDHDPIPPAVPAPVSPLKKKESSYWFKWGGSIKKGMVLMKQLKENGFVCESVADDLFISHCVNRNEYNLWKRREGQIIWL
ncbi:MAG: hypothetical protein ACE15F_15950 [bacterium]